MKSPQLARALKLFGLEKEAKNLRRLAKSARDDQSRERLVAAFRRLVRKRYHILSRMWHPDLGGDPAVMQLINAQYLVLSRLTIKHTEQPEHKTLIVVFVCRKQPKAAKPQREPKAARQDL